MNHRSHVVSLRGRESIEQAAAGWLAKLDGGELSGDDRAALRQWLSEDPEHGKVLRSYCSMWSEMDSLLNRIPVASDRPGRTPAAGYFSRPRVLAALAFGACVIALGALLAVGLKVDDHAPATASSESLYITGVGMQRLVRLSDGSTVHLNTNSIIGVQYSESRRSIKLLQGEAKFNVAHDPGRPFVVQANTSVVKAVGTEFVVRLTSDSIVVTVTDGRVQLSKRPETPAADAGVRQSPKEESTSAEVVLVGAGEEATISQQDGTTLSAPRKVSTEELTRQLSWLDGELKFDNARLEDVVAEINRYVPNRILIEDGELRDVRISGRFKIGDSEAMFDAIETSFDVQMRQEKDSTVRVYR